MTGILNNKNINDNQRNSPTYIVDLEDNVIDPEHPPLLFKMPNEETSDFSLPWCLALSKDRSFQPIPTASRITHESTGENNLLAGVLANKWSIPAVQTFIKRPCPYSSSPHHNIQVYMLFSLGRGVDGIAGTAHGAIVALMLDEVMGHLAAEVFGRDNIVTARLDVGFRRRLNTPRVVLARAFMEEGEEEAKRGSGGGKNKGKLEIMGRVEDGEGGVFAEGRSVFVRLRPKL